MRLQLTTASALLVVLPPVSLAAQESSAVRTRAALYQDDDATTVATTAVEAEAVTDSVGVRAGYLMDAVTTASVDVVAAATERWTERRDEIRGGVDVRAGDGTVSADAVRSIENDYDSWRLSLGGSLDVAERATTVALGLTWVDSDAGRQDDPGFEATQRIYGATGRLVQALDPDTLGAVGYTIQLVDGYQASPYRFVRAGGTTFVAERHPETRWRHALTGRIRHALGDSVTLAVDERLYADDWGVLATTTDARLSFALSDAVEIEIHNRFHMQKAASFWEESYDRQRRHMSVDRELSTFLDDYAGPAVLWTGRDAGPFDRLRLDLRADLFYYRFFDYAYLEGRVGTLVSVGAEGTL